MFSESKHCALGFLASPVLIFPSATYYHILFYSSLYSIIPTDTHFHIRIGLTIYINIFHPHVREYIFVVNNIHTYSYIPVHSCKLAFVLLEVGMYNNNIIFRRDGDEQQYGALSSLNSFSFSLQLFFIQ